MPARSTFPLAALLFSICIPVYLSNAEDKRPAISVAKSTILEGAYDFYREGGVPRFSVSPTGKWFVIARTDEVGKEAWCSHYALWDLDSGESWTFTGPERDMEFQYKVTWGDGDTAVVELANWSVHLETLDCKTREITPIEVNTKKWVRPGQEWDESMNEMGVDSEDFVRKYVGAGGGIFASVMKKDRGPSMALLYSPATKDWKKIGTGGEFVDYYFSRDRKRLLTMGVDGSNLSTEYPMQIWEVETRKLLHTVTLKGGTETKISNRRPTRSLRYLFGSVARKDPMRAFDLNTGMFTELDITDVREIAVSDDGSRMVVFHSPARLESGRYAASFKSYKLNIE